MAHYFCVDHGYFEHRKTRRLIRKEGDVAALVPLKLWRYASVCQADGDFSGYSIDELVEIVDLENVHKVKTILHAMREVGFFEPGSWKLHDFEEYNSYATRRSAAAKAAAKARWHKAVKKAGVEVAPEESPPNGKPPPRGGGPEKRTTRPRVSNVSERNYTASKIEVKRTSSASTPSAPSAVARRISLEQTLSQHPGRPDAVNAPRDPDELKLQRAEFRALKQTLADLNREIALTPHKTQTPTKA